jgi:site-specific DNA recombinase
MSVGWLCIRMLNQKGYRTRKKAKFTDTTVVRLIQDPTAKGWYRGNHTYRDDQGKLKTKDESDWVMTPVEAIVSEELWNQCNEILIQRKNGRPTGPKPTQLFTGLMYCTCGERMYVFSPIA